MPLTLQTILFTFQNNNKVSFIPIVLHMKKLRLKKCKEFVQDYTKLT